MRMNLSTFGLLILPSQGWDPVRIVLASVSSLLIFSCSQSQQTYQVSLRAIHGGPSYISPTRPVHSQLQVLPVEGLIGPLMKVPRIC